MAQFPILSGITASGVDFQSAYPVNMVPVALSTGISEGYLRPGEGINQIATGPGLNRGGREWRGVHYRVMGPSLCSISATGAITVIGPIAGTNWCTFTESFDYLAINGGNNVYLYDGTTLAAISDPDLGVSLDITWTNGYFLSTDGEFISSSDINDAFSWNPLRYASSEARPDPVVALFTIQNEVYAVNANTVEVFTTVINANLTFPFQRVNGAQLMKGGVGSRAVCELAQNLCILGGGKNEPPAVWLGRSGQIAKLSTRRIDDILKSYDPVTLSFVVLESRVVRNHEFLYIHLPDQTLVYDVIASQSLQTPVWHFLTSGVTTDNPNGGYRARGFVWCYGQWNVADPFGTAIGVVDETISSHYGVDSFWSFTTPIAYNEAKGIQVHELELIAITGSVAFGDDPLIATDWSIDGEVWSKKKYIKAGKNGQRAKKLIWDRQGFIETSRMQRFTGDSRAHLSFARLEAEIEELFV